MGRYDKEKSMYSTYHAAPNMTTQRWRQQQHVDEKVTTYHVAPNMMTTTTVTATMCGQEGVDKKV